jgi:hypothetical protein
MSTDGSKRSVNVAIALNELLSLFRIVYVVDVDGNEPRVCCESLVLSVSELP